MTKSWLNPISLIPDSIDPTMRKLLIGLIVVQFLAFVLYFILMIREYNRYKRDGPLPEDVDNTNTDKNTNNELNKEDTNNNSSNSKKNN